MAASAPFDGPGTTLATLAWPVGPSRVQRWVRSVALVLGGAALLTISAKVQVPGPVPMTLQTLAVLVLGAALGSRLAVGAVAAYVLEGAFGAPVFVNTPPLPAGLAYFAGPTTGYLMGFAIAAALVGAASDRGWARRPVAFAATVAAADLALLACGVAWLACFAAVGTGTGIGWSRAVAVGFVPFLLGEAVKVALASVALPVVLDLSLRLRRR